MAQMEIKIVAIDGLHNSGKSTQIERLCSNLRQARILGVVLRCHGFRPGIGLDANDPVSLWWQKNYPLFMVAGRKGGESFMKAEAKATNKLYQEFFDARNSLPKKMRMLRFDKAVIILDRSIISRLFIWQGHSRYPNYKDLLSFTHKDGDSVRVRNTPLPDLIIVLKVSQRELLKRNRSRVEAKDKILLGKKIILNRYHDYDKLVNNLPEDIRRRTFILDAERSETAIQREIMKLIRNQLL